MFRGGEVRDTGERWETGGKIGRYAGRCKGRSVSGMRERESEEESK